LGIRLPSRKMWNGWTSDARLLSTSHPLRYWDRRLELDKPCSGSTQSAMIERQEAKISLRDIDGADSSVVVFGSLCRGELTPGGDAPGREGVFGNLAFSPNLTHQIGGEDDSNSNTTPASFCFDVGHARQCGVDDRGLQNVEGFPTRLIQVHVSEVNRSSQQDPVSYAAQISFREISGLIPAGVPLIVECRVSATEIGSEIRRVYEALPELVRARTLPQACHPFA